MIVTRDCISHVDVASRGQYSLLDRGVHTLKEFDGVAVYEVCAVPGREFLALRECDATTESCHEELELEDADFRSASPSETSESGSTQMLILDTGDLNSATSAAESSDRGCLHTP